MKRIKTVNGYAIYQAVSERDAENYSCAVGSYNLYLATDVRDYGLANSSPEFEDIDSLAAALELANGSNHAIAEALAEELGGSTCIDMDLVLEIERRLDAGEDQETIREKLEPCVLDEDDEEETAPAKEVKTEWCENWIKARFAKHHGRPGPDAGFELNLFWDMAKASGLWTRGTYGGPMSDAMEKLCRFETVSDANGNSCYHVVKLREVSA